LPCFLNTAADKETHLDNAESKSTKSPEGEDLEGQGQEAGAQNVEGQETQGQEAEGQETQGQEIQGHDHGHEGHNHNHGADVPPMDPACKREINVEIPAEVVTKQMEGLVQQYSKQARIPGFRKGKVPASMVRSKFSNEITSDVVEHLVPQYFKAGVTKAGFKPVSQPHIYDLEYTPGEPMKFKAAFEILPEFDLGDYKETKIAKPQTAVTDEEVDAEVKQLQERQSSYDPIDEERGAKKGEFLQVSFEATPKDAPPAAEGAEAAPQPVHMDEVMVEIGGANTIPEFTEHLKGAKAGEDRNFDVAYAADFYDPRLAGKSFHYKVKVNALKKKTTPELNDEFAQELSPELKTFDDLKKLIRENMEAERKHKADHEAKDQLIEELLAKHDFPVPRSMVEHQIELRLERGLRALAAQGMKPEDMKHMDFARLRAGQLDAAIKEVKASVLLAKIAVAEKIQVTDEDLDSEIAGMAAQMQQPVEEVKSRLIKDNAVERLRDRMRSEKALNWLYSNAG
jgi:trigger factor